MRLQRWGKRLLRWLAGLLAVTVIGLAVLVGAFRLLVPQVSEYREAIAGWAGDAIGAPMEIEGMDVRWRWALPEIVFTGVTVRPSDPAIDPLAVDELSVRLSVLNLLRPGPVRPGRVTVRGGEFELVRDEQGRVRIPGVAVFDDSDGNKEDWRSVLARVLARADYEVLDSRLRLRDEVSGIAPLEAGIERLWMHSDEHRHRLVLALLLPDAVAGRLAVDVTAEGPPDRPGEWAWQAEMAASIEQLAEVLARFAPADWPAPSALLETDLEIGGTGAVMESVAGELSLRHLGPGPGRPRMSAPEAGGRFDLGLGGIDWHREAAGWRLAVDELAVSRGGQAWPASRLDLRWRGGLEDARITGSLRYARLRDLVRLARQFGRDRLPGVAWLDRLQPEGELRDVVTALRLRDGRLADYSVQGRVTRVGMDSWEKIPGFSGLSGWLQANQDGGRFDVDAGPVHLDYPYLFRGSITAERLQTAVEWSRHDGGWRIHARDIHARNRDARARAQLRLDVPPEGPPWLHLEAEVPEAHGDNVSDYLPVGKMPDKAVDWMDSALRGGVARNGRVLVDGPVEPFPYRFGEGRFEVGFDLSDGHLAFDEDWPALTGVEARVEFEGAGLRVTARDGRFAGYRLTSGEARSPDLDAPQPHLTVSARGEGRVSDGLALLRDSPVGERFGEVLDPVSLDGNSSAEVDLLIPLKAVSDLRLDGRATLAGTSGRIDWLPGAIRDVQGELNFTEDGVASDGLSGRYLDGPFRVTVDPGSRGRDADAEASEFTRIDLEGEAALEEAAAAWPDVAALSRASGRLDWRGEVRVPNREDDDTIEVSLESDLTDAVLALPAPLGKPAGEARPLSLRFTLDDAPSRVELDYGEMLDLTAAVDRDAPAGERVTGVRIDLNQPRPEEAVPPGIRVAGHLDRLDLLPWLALDTGRGGDLPAPEPEWLELHVDELQVGPLSFRDQNLGVSAQERVWAMSLAGPDAEGQLRIPRNGDPRASRASGRLEHLNLRVGEASNPGGATLSPLQLPAVDLRVETLLRDDMALGAAGLQLRRRPDGIALTGLSLEGSTVSLLLSGEWYLDPLVGPETAGTRGRLRGRVETDDVERALALFGYLPGVTGDEGRFDLDVSWQGSTFEALLNSLNGQASIELASGYLREVNPGAGRVFGLLSFTALPRRLFGDFRDIFGKGLRYDRIGGEFALVNGDAFTGNLALTGPVINVRLSGRAGLATRDYDQDVIIETPVGNSLPLAGAIAGGPSVGALMLVLSELFRGPLTEMGSLEYRIEGSWEDPRLIPQGEEARRALDEAEAN